MPRKLKDHEIFLGLSLMGIALRYWLMGFGQNDDLGTIYQIGSLPLGTNYYQAVPFAANWGPICYWFFQLFYRLPGAETLQGFHVYTTWLCSAADFITAWVLWQTFNLRAAAFFVFSPAAAIIAGYHCNAEPVLMAFAALGFYFFERGKKSKRITPLFYFFIGLSLATKHAFILFPIWFALTNISWKERLRCFVVTYGTWLIVVLPYLIPNPKFYFLNVIKYRSWSGNALIPILVKEGLNLLNVSYTHAQVHSLWFPLFLGLMLGLGFWIRKLQVKNIFLYYPIALVVTSSAIAPQYFAMVCLALATQVNIWTWAFHAYTGWHFSGHRDELHYFQISEWFQNRSVPEAGYIANNGLVVAQALLAVVLIWRLKSDLTLINAHASRRVSPHST